MAVSCSLLLSDSRRSVVGRLRSGTHGNLAYSPYGARCAPNRGTPRLGFTGQLYEPSLDAYALGSGHRVYNIGLFRFGRPDALSPFGEGGINAYCYCGNDPINRSDPTGQFIEVLLHPLTSTLVGAGSLLPLVGLQIDRQPTGFLRRATQIGFFGSTVALAAGIVRFAEPDSSAGKTISAVGMALGATALGFRGLHYLRGVINQRLGGKEILKRFGNLFTPGGHTRLHRSFALHAQREGLWHRAPDFTKEAMKIRVG